jgi:hypothetical protein
MNIGYLPMTFATSLRTTSSATEPADADQSLTAVS